MGTGNNVDLLLYMLPLLDMNWVCIPFRRFQSSKQQQPGLDAALISAVTARDQSQTTSGSN